MHLNAQAQASLPVMKPERVWWWRGECAASTIVVELRIVYWVLLNNCDAPE